MIEIKNNLFQPIAFHLPGVDKSLHMNPRERRLLREKDISDEIRAFEKRGIVTLKKANAPAPEPVSIDDQEQKPEMNEAVEISEIPENQDQEDPDTKSPRRGKRR